MNKLKKDIVIGMGEALWDVLPEGKKIGGAPANFAYHAMQFGFDGRVVSAVGNDALGIELRQCFEKKHLDINAVATVPQPTGTVLVELDSNGIPCYDIRENAAWDNIPFTPQLEALAREARVVCFGSLAQRSNVSRNTVQRFLDSMPGSTPDGQRTYKIFDINLRQDFYTKDIVNDSIERCNILKINDEELIIVSKLLDCPGLDCKETCSRLLSRYNLQTLILTCGVNGSYVFTPNDLSFVETPQVQVADTVGAGDSFTGAFIASLLSGCSVRQAHLRAVNTSAFVCTQHGAMPELPLHLKAASAN